MGCVCCSGAQSPLRSLFLLFFFLFSFSDFKQIQTLGADAHLNTCFKHFDNSCEWRPETAEWRRSSRRHAFGCGDRARPLSALTDRRLSVFSFRASFQVLRPRVQAGGLEGAVAAAGADRLDDGQGQAEADGRICASQTAEEAYWWASLTMDSIDLNDKCNWIFKS